MTSQPKAIRVGIVEDQRVVREGFPEDGLGGGLPVPRPVERYPQARLEQAIDLPRNVAAEKAGDVFENSRNGEKSGESSKACWRHRTALWVCHRRMNPGPTSR
jgi:hypothetical protein